MSRVKSKVPLGKQMKELRQQVEILRKQFQQFNFKMIEHHKQFDERTMTYWEYLWSVVEALKVDGKFEWLTEQRIDELRKVVIDRWQQEAFEHLKKDLETGSGVCERCHHKAGGPEFFVEDEEESVCPNCNSKGTVYLKNTETAKEVA